MLLFHGSDGCAISRICLPALLWMFSSQPVTSRSGNMFLWVLSWAKALAQPSLPGLSPWKLSCHLCCQTLCRSARKKVEIKEKQCWENVSRAGRWHQQESLSYLHARDCLHGIHSSASEQMKATRALWVQVLIDVTGPGPCCAVILLEGAEKSSLEHLENKLIRASSWSLVALSIQ